MAEIMDGKSLSLKILDDIKEKTALLKKRPGLSVILIGNNPASSIYVKNKENPKKIEICILLIYNKWKYINMQY